MTALPADRRTVHTVHCMGTVFSIDIRDVGDWTDAVCDVVGWLHQVDDIFSTYREDSDISRLRRGEAVLPELHPAVAEVLDLCVQMQRETDGYFTALWSGSLDPTGLVKGWAIERASEILRQAGSAHHAVNGGGDIQLAGEAAPGEPWRVGVSHPADRTQVMRVVTGRDFAVATSGRGERGDHIVNPYTRSPATELAAVTVIGRSLTRADAYATAALAMGPAAAPWLDNREGYGGFVVADRLAGPAAAACKVRYVGVA